MGPVAASAVFTVIVFESVLCGSVPTVAAGVEILAVSTTFTENEAVVATGLAVPLQTTAVLPPFGAQLIPEGGVPVTVKLYAPANPPEGVYVGARQEPLEQPEPVP